MNQHDIVVREIEQLVQVLAHVLFHKQAGHLNKARQMVDDRLARMLGMDAEELEVLTHSQLYTLTTPGGPLSDGKAIAVADLLQESDSAAAHQQALWLYELALTSGSAVPLDIHRRIAALRAVLP